MKKPEIGDRIKAILVVLDARNVDLLAASERDAVRGLLLSLWRDVADFSPSIAVDPDIQIRAAEALAALNDCAGNAVDKAREAMTRLLGNG